MIDGWAFTQHDGTVYWDRAGIETWTPQDGQLYDSLAAWIRARRADGGAGLPDGLKTILARRAVEADRGSEERAARLLRRAWLFEDAIGIRPAARRSSRRPSRNEVEIDSQDPDDAGLPRAELASPSRRFILNRGEYDQRRDKVGRATPAFLPPLPPGTPLNRLGLAQWLVAPEPSL